MRASPNLYTTGWGQVSRQVGHRSLAYPSANAADPSPRDWLHSFPVVVQNKHFWVQRPRVWRFLMLDLEILHAFTKLHLRHA